MKLELALLCVEMDCQEVFESTGSGYCPACGSGVALPMSQILNRTSTDAVAEPEPFRPAPLRLVVPDRHLERPEAMLGWLPETPAPSVEETKGAEGGELRDFRLYLEARLAELDNSGRGSRPLLAETG